MLQHVFFVYSLKMSLSLQVMSWWHPLRETSEPRGHREPDGNVAVDLGYVRVLPHICATIQPSSTELQLMLMYRWWHLLKTPYNVSMVGTAAVLLQIWAKYRQIPTYIHSAIQTSSTEQRGRMV